MSCPLQYKCKAYKENNCQRYNAKKKPPSCYHNSSYTECPIYQTVNSVWLEKDIEYKEVRDKEVIENMPFAELPSSSPYDEPVFPLIFDSSLPHNSESPNKEEYTSAELFLTYDEWKNLAAIIAHYILDDSTSNIDRGLLKKLINIKIK